MTCTGIYLQAFLGNEFYDGIINLEKLELCMKWVLTLRFGILSVSSYNKGALFFYFCVCDNVLNCDLSLTKKIKIKKVASGMVLNVNIL